MDDHGEGVPIGSLKAGVDKGAVWVCRHDRFVDLLYSLTPQLPQEIEG